MNGYEISWTALIGAALTLLGIISAALKQHVDKEAAQEESKRCTEADRREHHDMAEQLSSQGEAIAQLAGHVEMLALPPRELIEENADLHREVAALQAENARMQRHVMAVMEKQS